MQQKPIEEIKIILIGPSGNGKSALANTLTNRNECKESDGELSETVRIQIVEGRFIQAPVCVIDTPSSDTEKGRDGHILVEIINTIKENKDINGFVFVVDSNQLKYPESIFEYIMAFSIMYKGKEWYKHLVFVFTHFDYDQIEKKKNEKMIRCSRNLKNLLKNKLGDEITQEDINKIPFYFIDSIDAREENDEQSRSQIIRMLYYLSNQQKIYQHLGDINEEVFQHIKVKKCIVEDLFEDESSPNTNENQEVKEMKEVKEEKQEKQPSEIKQMKENQIKKNETQQITVNQENTRIENSKEEDVKKIYQIKDEVRTFTIYGNVYSVLKEEKFEGFFSKTKVPVYQLFQKKVISKQKRQLIIFTDGEIKYGEWYEIERNEDNIKIVDDQHSRRNNPQKNENDDMIDHYYFY